MEGKQQKSCRFDAQHVQLLAGLLCYRKHDCNCSEKGVLTLTGINMCDLLD